MAWQDAVGAIELISFVISSQWILAYSKVKTHLIWPSAPLVRLVGSPLIAGADIPKKMRRASFIS